MSNDLSMARSCFHSVQTALLACILPFALLIVLSVALPVPQHPALSSGTESSSTSGSASSCDTPFGTEIGVSSAGSVPAYSNCNSDFMSNLSNFVNVTIPSSSSTTNNSKGGETVLNVYTGMPWQCVEYARRYWSTTSPYTSFGSVDGASDIWTSLTNGTFISNLAEAPTFPLEKFANGAADTKSPPQVGDLLIYPIQPNGFPFGHVAVVLFDPFASDDDVNNHINNTTRSGALSYVHVGEQNWDSFKWAHQSLGYSRQLQVMLDTVTRVYSVHDPQGTIAGWVRRPASRP